MIYTFSISFRFLVVVDETMPEPIQNDLLDLSGQFRIFNNLSKIVNKDVERIINSVAPEQRPQTGFLVLAFGVMLAWFVGMIGQYCLLALCNMAPLLLGSC